jgi:D-3-phosphoglycerate dehydrogenase / 2-oxoglutarate reductase
MLDLIREKGPFDATLNGDDAFTPKVIDAMLPKLRVIAKYGIGLDSIDVKHATSRKLPVLNTPGVNHTTVAEHAIGLMIAAAKHFWIHMAVVKGGQWKRVTGYELYGKTLAIMGMGRIGKEVARRAAAFEMKLLGYDIYWDEPFAHQYKVKRCGSLDEALTQADIVSLHMPMTAETKEFINAGRIARMKDKAIIVNTARGGLVNEQDIAEACKSGKLLGYATDVLEVEPMKTPHPFQSVDNIIVTPHVGSRTYESVERQAMRAVLNLVNYLNGNPDYIQVNKW